MDGVVEWKVLLARERREESECSEVQEREIGWLKFQAYKITTMITLQYSFYPTQDHSNPLLPHTLLPQHTATVTTATVTTATVTTATVTTATITPHLNDSSNRGRVVIQGAAAISGLHGNTSGSTEAL